MTDRNGSRLGYLAGGRNLHWLFARTASRRSCDAREESQDAAFFLTGSISWTSKDVTQGFTRCSFALNCTNGIPTKSRCFYKIGKLIAYALENGISERQHWYGPSEKLPDQPLIDAPTNTEFDTLVVDLLSARTNAKGTSKVGAGSKE